MVSYGLALGASYLWTADDLNGSKDLRIPLAGPWIALSKTGCSNNDPGLQQTAARHRCPAADHRRRGAGRRACIIGEGLFLNTSSSRSAPQKAAAACVQAVPFNFEKGGVGLGLVGSF